jgi:hypothetical protein
LVTCMSQFRHQSSFRGCLHEETEINSALLCNSKPPPMPSEWTKHEKTLFCLLHVRYQGGNVPFWYLSSKEDQAWIVVVFLLRMYVTYWGGPGLKSQSWDSIKRQVFMRAVFHEFPSSVQENVEAVSQV